MNYAFAKKALCISQSMISSKSSHKYEFIDREYVHSLAVYLKYLMRLEKLTILELLRENYHFSQQS